MGKFKFSYKRFAVTVMVGAILAATTATAAFSYAWFTNHNNVTNNDLHGSTAGAYFARGDGSSTNPYVINKPIHLYNLAWLQYIGAFKDASGTDKEPYFLIESNLNMAGWTLPPIGTETNPFMGHLDGFQKKVENLTISNSFAAYNGKHPAAVTKDNFETLNITGLFGVIEQPTKDTTTPSLQNLYVDKLTVSSTTKKTLTGLVAGYVNGKIDGVGISDSKLDLASGTTTTSYKDTTFNNISKYTSVGYCTDKYEASYVKTNTTMYKPAQVGKNVSFNPTGAGGGTENDWGGSINMRLLHRRINYISAVSSYGSYGSSTLVDSENYNFHGLINSSLEFMWNGNGAAREQSTICGIKTGTIIPLNIDESVVFEGGERTYGSNSWKTTKWYVDKKKEKILSSNTGYLIGGSTNSKTWGDIRTKIVPTSSAFNSSTLNDGVNGLKIYSFNTIKGGSVQEIGANNQTPEQQFGYKKYENVHQDFVDSMQGSKTVHGFHFMQGVADDISQLKTLKASNVTIANTLYPTYEFITSGLNFSVANSGRITALLGTHYLSGQDQSMFDFFRVERENGAIKTFKKIKAVYESDDGTIDYSYYNDNTIPSGKLVFDFSKVTGSSNAILTSNRAYYFEFPVAKGDYVIGKSLNSDKVNAYLMYLDIGANAGGTSGNKVDRTKIYEAFEQVNEVFKYPNGVEIVNFADAGVDAKKFAVVVGTSYSGQVALKYDGKNSASFTVNASTDTGTGLGYYEAGLNFTSGSTAQVGATITHTRTQRLTYFDHYREDASDTTTPYTNVLQFSQTQTMKSGTWSSWSETTRSDYQSGKGNADDFGKLSEKLTIYDDEGKAAAIPAIATPSSEEAFWKSKVFTLQTKDPTIQFINVDWIQTGSYPTGSKTSPYVFKVSGYKFTMKDSAGTDLTSDQYSISIKDADYAVSVNA